MRKINQSMLEVTRGQMETVLSRSEEKKFSADILQVLGSLVCLTAAGIYGKLNPSQGTVTGMIYFVGISIIGGPITITAVRGFLRDKVCSSMEILVTIAMIVSVLDGRYIIAILIPLLLTLVHFLEEKSIIGGRDAIDGLKKMQPTTALRLENGVPTEVSVQNLSAGDLILVKPGMGFPIDGKIFTGVSSVNQQSLTGETLPSDVKPGDIVYAGTLNIQGLLTVTVERTYQDTSFQKILKTLEDIEKSETPESRMVDRFMAYYIPLALVAATAIWLLTKQIDRAVAILVVSCPCGHMLVSSAPLIASLGLAARRGILIKNANFIERLAYVHSVFFDKTGTLTNGEIILQRCIPAMGITEEVLFETAFMVARHSTHPLSRAIAAGRRHNPERPDEGIEVIEYSGMGLAGIKEKGTILLGNERLFSSFGVTLPNNVLSFTSNETLTTPVYVAKEGKFLGTLVFNDTLREDAPRMIESLKSMGIEETWLLTGDKINVAERIKETCAISNVKAQLLPEQKQQFVKDARKLHKVAFVGDGINDALALSEADVGIAMGASSTGTALGILGNDTAIQSADIVLMNNRLDNIPFVINLARKSREIIRQNIIIAFLSSLFLISLAAGGIVTTIPGTVLHNVGAFIVLFNSGRIRRIR
jgi:Cd2+/Zn2+-exporting ATPase/Cu+-exporting ATPase